METRSTAPNRKTALERLKAIPPGHNLYELAAAYGITVLRNGRLNKGWAGQTLERAAGPFTTNNLAGRDGADFELKSTTLVKRKDLWVPRETIKVTTLNPERILDEDFESSSLWTKLSRLILVGCAHPTANNCEIVYIASVNTVDTETKEAIENFWMDVKHTVCDGEIANYKNLGSSDDLLQLRPTGTSRDLSLCPITQEPFPSCAFYATKRLIQRFFAVGVSDHSDLY
ncbi:MAG: MutH/Sau3AI family endonuclease [Bdellovibrionota bacterium]